MHTTEQATIELSIISFGYSNFQVCVATKFYWDHWTRLYKHSKNLTQYKCHWIWAERKDLGDCIISETSQHIYWEYTEYKSTLYSKGLLWLDGAKQKAISLLVHAAFSWADSWGDKTGMGILRDFGKPERNTRCSCDEHILRDHSCT